VDTIIGAIGAALVVLLTLVELFLPAERSEHRPLMGRRVAESPAKLTASGDEFRQTEAR